MLAIISTVAISLTLTVSLHDLIFARMFPVRAQAVCVSLFAGMALGGFLTCNILGSAAHERGRLRHLVWTGVTVGIGLGLLLLRLSMVHGERERYVAIGFALFEVAFVLALHVYADGMHRAWKRRREALALIIPADLEVEAATRQLQTRQAARQACEATIKEAEVRIARQDWAAKGYEKFAEAAKRAIIGGYRKAIEETRGELVRHTVS